MPVPMPRRRRAVCAPGARPVCDPLRGPRHAARRRVLATAALALAALLAPGPSASLAAQSHYGMSEEGRIAWNGTVLNDLAGDFDVDLSGSAFFFRFTSGFAEPFGSGGLTIIVGGDTFFFFSNPGGSGFFFATTSGSDLDIEDYYERWADHVVVGPDRWSLRADGRISRNGKKHAELFSVIGSPDWLALDVVAGPGGPGDPDGQVVHALRRDGLLATDVHHVVRFEHDESFFTRVAGLDGTAAALRADGAVFLADEPDEPAFFFTGGMGASGSTDGETLDTVWLDLTVHPTTGDLYGLRRDGVVQRAVLLPSGTAVYELARLPAPLGEAGVAITLGRLVYPSLSSYADLEILAGGDWVALRGDGSLFAGDEGPGAGLLVTYEPPDAVDAVFTDLAVDGDQLQAIRRDGRIFRGLDPEPYMNMPGTGYLRTAITAEPPDLESIDNHEPRIARYRTVIVDSGEALGDGAGGGGGGGVADGGGVTIIPVIATDTDRPADQLVVEPVGELPPGVQWNATERTFAVGPAPGATSFALRVQVDDGVAKHPRRFKLPVKLVAPDDDPLRNLEPGVSKIGKARALVGVESVFTLIPFDRDGDAVTITPVLDKGVFALPGSDATYDDAARELRWTPTLDHVGRTKAEFRVSDGTVTRKYRVQLQVKAPLVTE